MKNFILFFFCIAAVFFQLSAEGAFFSERRIPDLALALVITLVVANGFEKSVGWIVLIGLVIDAGSASIFGTTALVYLLVGWMINFLITFANIRSRKIFFLGFLAAVAALFEIIKDLSIAESFRLKVHYLQKTFHYPINFFSLDYLLKIFYTVLAVYIVYYIFRKISRMLFLEPIKLAKRKF